MPPSLLPPTPEELEELRQRRRASQLKGYGEGVDDPTAQALLNVRRNLGEAGRAVVGAKPYDETNPTGSYRAVQALMNAPTPAAIIPEMGQAVGKAAGALSGLGALGVVKPKGGNWFAGTVERGLSRFKQPDRMLQNGTEITLEQAMNWPGLAPEAGRNLAINNWIDTKLGKYVKNEMATPEDPVRALAERGVLHVDPETLNQYNPKHTAFEREMAGFPSEGMSRSPGAQRWEDITDYLIESDTAGSLIDPAQYGRGFVDKALETNPWLAKVDPETPVYGVDSMNYRVDYEEAGFRHLIDELTNATDPNSGLPRSLQLSPDKLQKVTVPQAVELVDKINKWRAEQKVAADLKRSQNAATVEFKAYPQPNYFSAREPGSERFPGGFFTPDRAAAQKFGESFGKPVQGYVIEPRRTATEADVENVARRLGIYDEGVPADQYLTQGPEQIYSEAPQVIAELRNLGFDSARLNDGMSAQPSLVALDPNIVRPAIDNPKGLRWVELTLPSEQEDVSSMIIQNAGKYSILEPGQRLSWKDPASGRVLFDTPEKASAAYNRSRGVSALEESLKYEGETMGHCVGGYCPDVESGRTRIYSLRDAKGEPHVTIEVRPGIIEPRMNGDVKLPDEIKQIKGKANRAPKDEYLPFVQDFVRSGQWSSVGDLGNTGLIRIDSASDLAKSIKAAGGEPPNFVTQQELTELLRQNAGLSSYAAGGAVRMQDGGKPPKRRASDLPGYGKGSTGALGDVVRGFMGEKPAEPTNPSELFRLAQALGAFPPVAGVVKGAKGVKSLGEMIDREVRKVRRLEELGKADLNVKVGRPAGSEVTGWHITQDTPGILKTGALTNRDVGAGNIQGYAPAHVGGAYFYSDPQLALAKREDLLEMLGQDPELAAQLPILRAQLRRGNRLLPDEDVGLNVPWQRSFEEGSFATGRPVMLNQVDRIYASDPDVMKDLIRDTAVRQRRYKGGGKVKAPANPNEPEVRGLPDPRLDNLQIYAQTVSREMFPKDPVKRDAARHIIASSILAQKLNPSLARGLGQGYELVNAPMAHIKSALGMGPVPAGYEMDTVNNALGSEMPFTTQAELQRNARQAIESGRARLTPDEAQPYRRGGRVKIEKHPTLMADELLFKGHRK